MTDSPTPRPVPCGELIAPAGDQTEPRCWHDLPLTGCAVCPMYVPGLHRDERQRCEVWTRVMGYHRPVSAFNAGKAAEHRERQYFTEQPSAARPRYQFQEGAGHD